MHLGSLDGLKCAGGITQDLTITVMGGRYGCRDGRRVLIHLTGILSGPRTCGGSRM